MRQNENGPGDVQSPEPPSTKSGDKVQGNSTLLARYKLAERASLDDRLGRRDIAVLFVIFDHIDKRTRDCFPGVDRIARLAGVDRTTATRSIKRLVGCGYVVRKKGSGRLANTYQVPARGTCSSAPTSEDRSTCSPAPTSELSTGNSAHLVGANPYADDDRLLIGLEPEKEEPEKEPRTDANAPGPVDASPVERWKGKSKAQTFDNWLRSFPKGAKLVDLDVNPTWALANDIGLPEGWLTLAWRTFMALHAGSEKRSADWLAVFDRHVRLGWLNLWSLRNGIYKLTTAGEQAAYAHDMPHLVEIAEAKR
jgi:hypothetical protein